MQKNNKGKLRQQFFISYLIMLILPMLVCTMIYNMSYKLVEKRELEMNTMLVNESMQKVDQYIMRIDNVLIEISQNANLIKLMKLKGQPQYSSADASLAYTVYNELSSLINYSNLEADLVIYMSQPDLVFDGKSIVYGQENFYNMAISYQDVSYEAFKTDILDQYHLRDIYGDTIIERKKTAIRESMKTRTNGFLYVQTLPLIGGRTSPLGTAVIHIDKKMNEILNLVPASTYGSTYITDENQGLIAGVFSSDFQPEMEKFKLEGQKGAFYHNINGQRMLVSFVRSDYNNWYYISMSPMNLIMSEMRSFQILVLAVSVVVVIIGTLISFYFSGKSSKPMEEALTEIRKNYGQDDATLGNLSKRIHKIISDNFELQDAMERQKLQSRSNFYYSLFHGEFFNDVEIEANAKYLGVDLKAACYCVLVIHFGGFEAPYNEDSYLKADIARMLTKKVSLRNASFRSFTCPLSDRRLGVILCFDINGDLENRQAIEVFAAKMAQSEENDYACGISYFAGSFVSKLSDICISYGEADSVYELHRDDPGGAALIFYRDTPIKKRGYFYPGEIEKKISHLASVGDKDRLQEVLDYIYKENQQLSLDKQMSYVLLMDMYATLINTASSMKVNFFPLQLYKLRPVAFNFEQEYAILKENFGQISGMSAKKEEIEVDWFESMEKFLYENIGNCEINVALMSQHFHISESYFSQYFKRVMGQTFSKYLETLRINKACALLQQTDKNIDNIAFEIGYTSSLTFRRAFKKVMGITPTAFREKGVELNVCDH